MDGITELAKLLKERENPNIMGIQIGKVVVDSPDIKISAGDKIILDRDELVFSAHILKDYKRNYITSTNEVNWSIEAQIKFTDGLKIGDEVILIPTTDEQTYYVLDKVVRL